jgi:hypothetical protein
MQFAELILYKVLPCPNGENCESIPREIATNNQYYDKELSCPFYHHYRDQRRVCINQLLQEEFIYQANYFDDEKQATTKDNYSQNYFESMFHPLYYKMFQCTRKYCKAAPYCPFYHADEEKKIWGDQFLKFINKERVSYVKEKKKSSTLSSTENSFSLSPKSEPFTYCRTPGETRGSNTPLTNYSPFTSPRIGFNKKPLGRMDKIEKYCPNKYPSFKPHEPENFNNKVIESEDYLSNYSSSYTPKSSRRTTFVSKKLIKEIRVS